MEQDTYLDLGHSEMELYDRILRREPLRPEDGPLLQRLRDKFLVEDDPHSPTHPIPLDPRDAVRQLAFRSYDQMIERLHYMKKRAPHFWELANHYTHARGEEGGSGGLRILHGREDANAAIGAAFSRAKTALYTAQPTARNPDDLERSIERDGALIERGVRLYTIYPASARTREPEGRWVEHMTKLGAEVRTCPVPFPRIIHLEDVAAFVEGPRLSGEDIPPAIEVGHPSLLGWIHLVYQHYWDLSQPWTGGRPHHSTGCVLTTARQRAILRLLGNGVSRAKIIKDLDVKERTLRNELAKLRKTFGVETDFELALRWRESDEYDMP